MRVRIDPLKRSRTTARRPAYGLEFTSRTANQAGAQLGRAIAQRVVTRMLLPERRTPQ